MCHPFPTFFGVLSYSSKPVHLKDKIEERIVKESSSELANGV